LLLISMPLLHRTLRYCVGGCWLDWNFWVTYVGVKIPCSATCIQSGVIPKVCFYHCLVFVPLSFNCTNELARVLYCVHGVEMI
jgi:hypothetical protein